MHLGLFGGFGYERMRGAEGRLGLLSRGYRRLRHSPRRANHRLGSRTGHSAGFLQVATEAPERAVDNPDAGRFIVEVNFASVEAA